MQVENDSPTESSSTLKDETPMESFAAEKQVINSKPVTAAQILIEDNMMMITHKSRLV